MSPSVVLFSALFGSAVSISFLASNFQWVFSKFTFSSFRHPISLSAFRGSLSAQTGIVRSALYSLSPENSAIFGFKALKSIGLLAVASFWLIVAYVFDSK
jgi:hypothetical protein